MRAAACVCALAFLAVGMAFGAGGAEGEYSDLFGVDSVIVEAGGLDVLVRAVDGASVAIRPDLPQSLLFNSRGYRIEHRRSGSRLTIQVRQDFPFGFPQGGRLVLEVPRGTDLRIDTSSGSVSVEGLEARRCQVTTVSGRISIVDARADLDLKSTSGEVSIDSSEGRVSAETVSGRIKARGMDLGSGSTFASVSGDIDVRLAMPLDDLRLDLSSVSGRIVAGSIRAERGLRMGFGGVSVKAHTVSGEIVFKEE
jgi:hypothetical protein